MNSILNRRLRLETLEPRRLLTTNVINLGETAFVGDVEGDLVAYAVVEAASRTDFNDDGDTSDFVLHLYDAATQSSTNVGLALDGGAEVEGQRVVFAVRESAQGGTDLNGDGDTSDSVLHVYDAASGQLTNLGFDGRINSYTPLRGDLLAFTVSEAAKGGVDLNGDDDFSDHVLHLHNLATGVTTNLGYAGFAPDWVGSRLVFRVLEQSQNNTDLNGDGDTTDNVLHVYDTVSGVTTNSEISAIGIAGTAASDQALLGDRIAFSVYEQMEGSHDLNGDGDFADHVLHVVDLASMTITNLEVAVGEFTMTMNDQLLAYEVIESDQGSTDLNQDGDTADRIMHVFDLSTGTPHNLELALDSRNEMALVGDQVGFLVSENSQGQTDLNGDGYIGGSVLHIFDTESGVSNQAVIVADPNTLMTAATHLAFEFVEAGEDLNGDGDRDDTVLYLYSSITGTTFYLPYAIDRIRTPGLADNFAVFAVPESEQGGVDLNGDGDTLDKVLHVHDLALGVTTNLSAPASYFTVAGNLLMFLSEETVPPLLHAAYLAYQPDPIDLIELLATDIASLDLQSGIDNSLMTKLDSVLRMLTDDQSRDEAVAGKLQALIHEIEAQRDKRISAEMADLLIADVEELLDVLET